MKWKTLLLSFFLCSPLFAKGGEQNLGIYDFSKGLDSYHSSLSLPDGFVQDSQNVLFDAQAPVSKRNGFTVAFSSKSYAYQSSWAYTDATNTSWIIVRASDSIIASNLAGAVVRISTVSANDVVGETNAFGSAYFVDPTQAVYSWNGSTTTYVANSPHGSLIAQFHSRLWVSGVAIPNGSQVYSSGFLSGTNWTLGPNATDPVQLTAGLQDNFDNVTAMYAYLDTLYLFKHYSIYSLSGFDQTSFLVSFVSSECGCIDQNSIQTFGGALKFVSLRGVENFDGYRCTRISDAVKNKVDPAIQVGSFSQSSWVQSQASDWNAGTIIPSGSLSLTLAVPGLTVSTFTFSGSSANWNVLNNGFESNGGGFSQPTNWQMVGSTWNVNSLPSSGASYQCGSAPSARTGSYYASNTVLTASVSPPFFNASIIDAKTKSSIFSETEFSPPGNVCSWTPIVLPVAATTGTIAYVQFGFNNNQYIMQSSTFTIGSDVIFYEQEGSANSVGGSFYYVALDDVLIGVSSYVSSATFVGPAGYVRSNDTWSSSGPVVSIQQSSNSLLGPWKTITISTGTDVPFGNSYLRWAANFTRSGTNSATTDLQSISIVGNSTGTFVSQPHNLGTIASFGNFSVDQTVSGGGDSINFSICTSSSVTMFPKTCALQPANSQITVATNTFVQVTSSFSVIAATQTPTLRDFTVQWFSGAKSIPMASTVWDNRYWLSLTTSTADSSNDTILVLGNNGAWADFDIHAAGLVQYRNSLYHADSLATGNVYLDNQGYADNGAPINAYIKTKDYTQGDLTQDDFLEEIWPSMDNSGPYNVTVNYYPDRSTSGYSLGQVAMSEFSNDASAKMEIPIDPAHQVFGKSMAYFFQASDANSPWNFYGLKEIYRARPTQ